MGSCGPNEPVRVYATGACNVDKKILELKDSNPSEAIDTANILIEFESGSTATIQARIAMHDFLKFKSVLYFRFS